VERAPSGPSPSSASRRRSSRTADFPFLLPTGRNAYQFHIRTKTSARTAPHRRTVGVGVGVVEAHRDDARQPGLVEGVDPQRGTMEPPVRISRIRRGVVFVPIHHR